MTCTMTLTKVKCAARRPHSLIQTPSGSSSKTESRRLEMGLGAVDDHQCPKYLTELSVHSTMLCWRTPSLKLVLCGVLDRSSHNFQTAPTYPTLEKTTGQENYEMPGRK